MDAEKFARYNQRKQIDKFSYGTVLTVYANVSKTCKLIGRDPDDWNASFRESINTNFVGNM
jgi:hypothetical protein